MYIITSYVRVWKGRPEEEVDGPRSGGVCVCVYIENQAKKTKATSMGKEGRGTTSSSSNQMKKKVRVFLIEKEFAFLLSCSWVARPFGKDGRREAP